MITLHPLHYETCSVLKQSRVNGYLGSYQLEHKHTLRRTLSISVIIDFWKKNV
jgi:hypothetical protein